MRNIQQLLVALMITLLAACGGGGTLDSGTGGGGSTDSYAISVVVVDSLGNELREVSQTRSGEVKATLLRNNQPAQNQLISFTLSGDVGVLSPVAGTARTDENGVAKVQLFAGEVPGAGAVTATFNSSGQNINSAAFVFDSTGDLSDSVALSVRVLDAQNAEVRTVSHATPRKLEATLFIAGEPAAFRIVKFSTEFAGVINPNSGLAMTNENGVAVVDLLAGTQSGAGQIIAEFTTTNNVVVQSPTYSFTSAGDAPLQGNNSGFVVALSILDAQTRDATNTISASKPALIRARITTLQNAPVVNQVVSFDSTLGRFRPALGTALTDENGFAELTLTAGTVEGAGTVTAQYQSVRSSAGFFTQGNEIDPSQVDADISFRLLTDCATGFRSSRDPSLCNETTSISAEKPGVLFIKVVRAGSTTPLNQVLVTAQTTLGNISPSTGTAITDANGVAVLDLLAGRDVGAGEVTVTALNGAATKAFEIGAAQVTITVSSGLANGEQLAAGSTTLIAVEIRNSENDLYTPPLDVEFTSNCVQAGQSVIDNRVTSVGGVARATYRADGCVGNDVVTATVITGGDSVTGSVIVPVSASNIGALEFVSASTDYLALKGTGGANRSETAIVSFRLKDENGANASGRLINFRLSTTVGGLSLEPASALTNNDGLVQTVIRSGTVPTPVRVIAIYADDSRVVQAPSDNLNVSTGVADNNSFSLALGSLNVRGLNYDGSEVPVSVFLADHFNNPVPDGTAVSFVTEGGAIQPSCLTGNGVCSVNWRSQNPRPYTGGDYKNSIVDKCHDAKPCPLGIVNNDGSIDLPLGGRATILAYAIGEESFSDRNGNGKFDVQDYVMANDIGEAFIDHNENGFYDGVTCSDATNPCEPSASNGGEFEEFVDFNTDGVRNAANGMYNGLLCSEEQEAANVCSRQLLNVYRNSVIVMSGDEAYFRLTTIANDCNTIAGVTASEVRINKNGPVLDLGNGQKLCNVDAINLSDDIDPNTEGNQPGATSVQLRVYISDLYNNPLPVGSEVSISADNGLISGPNSFTFPNTTSVIPLSIGFSMVREPATGGNTQFDGLLTIGVTTPSGLASLFSIPITDDR